MSDDTRQTPSRKALRCNFRLERHATGYYEFTVNTSIETARFSAEFAANKATAPALLQQSGVKYWEIVANQLSEAGWTWGHVRFVRDGQYLDLVDAYRGDGKRHIVCADDKLSAFLELQRIINDDQPKVG
jgi:hypothetical protein